MSFLATSSFQSQVSTPPEALKQLVEAGKVLERQTARDTKYPDLADLLMCNLFVQLTFNCCAATIERNTKNSNCVAAPTSGEYEQPLGSSRQPFLKAVARPLPDILSEQLKGEMKGKTDTSANI
jgi:hypothetical protein